jgi:hypothetical protein
LAFFDLDPVTGLRRDMTYDEETGVAKIIHSQDLSEAVDYAKAHANVNATDHGIKKGLWKYAIIPPLVQIELRNKGIDIYSKDPAMLNRLLAEIDANYPDLKLTTKKHRVQQRRHV